MIKKYDISQSPLYKLKNKRKLEQIIELNKYELNKFKEWNTYKVGKIPKKDGDFREINKPNYKLKRVQKKLQMLLSKIKRPEWLISGEKNKCYINNAEYHIGAKYIITADIKKFYDNCTREYVYMSLINKFKMSNDIAGIVTDIVTHNQGIPTGASTSQLIAYYAYENMFNEINITANKYGCKFSLFVDDMTFSSVNPINVQALKRDIDIILRKYGHRLKSNKFKYFSKDEDKLITGVTLKPNNDLAVSNRLRYNIINDFKTIKYKKGLNSDLPKLKGRIAAAKMIERNIFPQITSYVSSLK
ncbi:reverse transcriptase family protein [uncultured Clostridium sp.]|uniref:reverse transcriptase family protein n=1 Tax=uncultured Clostridium sp. TaxID=59620 RepID=UPI0025EDE5CE|nr:reverse transcriptase family protein [uncultured Clostridium sp.]